MSEAISTLTLEERNRYRSDSSAYPGRSFFDFVIDGVALYDMMGQRRDLVSTLWTKPEVPAERQRYARRLLTLEPGDVPGDRVSLYVCPECGDLGCGAITMKIEVGVGEVRWFDFGYENTYEDRIPFDTVGPLSFDRQEYERLIGQFIS
jgi:hypothetical protein